MYPPALGQFYSPSGVPELSVSSERVKDFMDVCSLTPGQNSTSLPDFCFREE